MQWEKQPSEFCRISVDLSKTNVLGVGESFTTSNVNGSLTAKIFDASGTDISATILAESASLSGDVVSVLTKAGTEGDSYDVQFLVPTTAGQIIEVDGTLSIVEYRG